MHLDADQHPERRGSDEEGTVRQEAEVGQRLDRLQPAGRPAEPVEKAHRTHAAADCQITSVGIDRQERGLGRSRAFDLDVEIGAQQDQAGIVPLAEQGDQRSFITDRPRRDPLRHTRERERLSLGTQQVKLVPLVPGEDPAPLSSQCKSLQRRLRDDRPGDFRFQSSRCPRAHFRHRFARLRRQIRSQRVHSPFLMVACDPGKGKTFILADQPSLATVSLDPFTCIIRG